MFDIPGKLARAFERAGPLLARLQNDGGGPFRSNEDLLERAQAVLAQMTEAEQIAVIDAHPRIGEHPGKVSAGPRGRRVLTYDHYAKQPEADVEDIIGARNYVELVNRTYSVQGPELMQVPTKSPCRILKEAEDHFRTVKPPVPEFDHYAPSRYFCEHQSEVLAAMPEVEAMLDRFEAIFKDLNPMITA